MKNLTLIILLLVPTAAHAYVGPSLGGGTIAVILGFAISIFAALFAIFYYPAKRMLIKVGFLSGKKNEENNDEVEE